MEISEIMKALEKNTAGHFPKGALEEAISRKEEITPHLLDTLVYAEKNMRKLYSNVEYFAHMNAMFLLAQFREEKAYPLIVKLFSHSGSLPLDFTGDVVTEDLHRLLASVCGGNTSLINKMNEDRELDEYTRDAAARSWLVLVANDIKTREEAFEYYLSLFRGGYERKPSHIWGGLVSDCLDLFPEGEFIAEIKKVFDEGLVEESFVTMEDLYREQKGGRVKALNKLRAQSQYSLVNDAVMELKAWAKLSERPAEKTERGNYDFLTGIPAPVEGANSVGRNDPCPCGSGKKYKKCCLEQNMVMKGPSVQELYSNHREQMPVLVNYDKDPIVFCKVYFSILKKDAIKTVLNSSADIEYDDRNKKWVWLSPGINPMGGNTILGTISIEGDELVLDTNSFKRVSKFKKYAEKSLKGYISYLKTEAKDITAIPEPSPEEKKKAAREQEELMNIPEIKAMLSQKADDYYLKSWVRQKIPMLGDITPYEAAKTEEGRQILNKMIDEIDERQNASPLDPFRVDTLALRKKLGLAR